MPPSCCAKWKLLTIDERWSFYVAYLQRAGLALCAWDASFWGNAHQSPPMMTGLSAPQVGRSTVRFG